MPRPALRRDGGTAVLGAPAGGAAARPRRRRRRALPPVPPVPGPGEPVLPRRPRRRRVTGVVLAVLVAGLVAVAVARLGAPERGAAGAGSRRPPADAQRPAVPTSWQAFQSPDGAYRLAHPPGWSPVDRGAFTDFVEPGGGRFFRVQPTADGLRPLAAQRSLESSFMARHAGDDYRRVRLGTTTFKDLPAAEWEFTFVDGGLPRRGYDITFVAGGRRHAILFQAGADQWRASQDELRAFLAGYRPG